LLKRLGTDVRVGIKRFGYARRQWINFDAGDANRKREKASPVPT
jgi:hypothetical protein